MEESLHLGEETILHKHVGTEATGPLLNIASDGLTVVNGQTFYVERVDVAPNHGEGYAINIVLIDSNSVNREPFMSYAGFPIDSIG